MFGSLMMVTHRTPCIAGATNATYAAKRVDRIGSRPTAVAGKPCWMCDVMQRDNRLQPKLAAVVDHRSIAVPLGNREAARSRFKASPFDAEPVAGESQVRRQRHVPRPEPVAVQ